MLIILALGLSACGGTTDGGYPVEESAADSLPSEESALQPVTPAGNSAESMSSDDDSAEAYPAQLIEDPMVIEADEELETVELPEESDMPKNFIPDSAAPVVNAVVTDVFERTGSKADTVNVVKFEETTWNDGSLGCPEEGMMYTQALTDGYWIVVEIDGEEYDYRANKNGDVRLCEDPPTDKTTPIPPADS